MSSVTESELGRLFENTQKATSMRTALAEMSHQQPTTLVAIDNTVTNRTVTGTEKKKDLEK